MMTLEEWGQETIRRAHLEAVAHVKRIELARESRRRRLAARERRRRRRGGQHDDISTPAHSIAGSR